MEASRVAKIATIGCILLFLCTDLAPAQATPIRITESPRDIYIGLQPIIRFSWDGNATSKPIMPRTELRVVNMNISFTIAGGYLASLFARLLSHRIVLASLEIADKPDWCTATLSNYIMGFTIPSHLGVIQTQPTTLCISLSGDAPAYHLGAITLRARVEPLYGFFGLVRFMKGTTNEATLSFYPAYQPLLFLTLPQGNTIETPPLTTVDLPVIIKNVGNGRSVIFTDLDNPDHWPILFPNQFTLDVNQSLQIMVHITAPTNFTGDYVFKLNFTPHFAYDLSQTGETVCTAILAYYHPS
jgi:hypothetical protein